jgi:outer membrane protein TolC
MKKSCLRQRFIYWLCIGLTAIPGCTPNRFSFDTKPSTSYYQNFATQIEYPDVQSNLDPSVTSVQVPLSFENPAEVAPWELSLPEAMRIAMGNSEVLRSLGASVVQAPASVSTTYNPAITESNPQSGVEAALSAFDTQATGRLFWRNTDRPVNIVPAPGIPSTFNPSSALALNSDFSAELSKRSATGARFALRHNVGYLNNEVQRRVIPTDFTGWFEAEWRQPLMQGGGLTYNQIAGPNSGIGVYNGVLLARINTDIALHDFENNVISLVNDVEGAYWDLYFAYRNLEAQVFGRESSLRTWQRVKELQNVDARGGEADAEAQARAQFFRFEALVQNALAGNNGIYAIEQRLRYVMGLPAGDGRLIKPISKPLQAHVVYDWNSAMGDALTQRVEVRRQKWQIKRRELELVAARQNRRPRLDAVTQYRWYGLGDHLLGSYNSGNDFESLYQNIGTGNYQEFNTGMELSYPVGFRQASVAVRNAQWSLTREQAILKEQELRISHDLSNSAREIARNFELTKTNFNRVVANEEQVEVLRARYERGLININFLLQAQQELSASQSEFYRTLIDYNLAIRNFHREKGSLLAYNQVGLAEGQWAASAYDDAREKGQWLQPRKSPEKTVAPRPISQGAYDPSAVGSVPMTTPVQETALPNTPAS